MRATCIDMVVVLLTSTIGAVVMLMAHNTWLGVAVSLLISASYLWGLSPRLHAREKRLRIAFESKPEARLVRHR